jgi:hypothetical protein
MGHKLKEATWNIAVKNGNRYEEKCDDSILCGMMLCQQVIKS